MQLVRNKEGIPVFEKPALSFKSGLFYVLAITFVCHCEESRSDDEAISLSVAKRFVLPISRRLLRRTKVLLAMTLLPRFL